MDQAPRNQDLTVLNVWLFKTGEDGTPPVGFFLLVLLCNPSKKRGPPSFGDLSMDGVFDFSGHGRQAVSADLLPAQQRGGLGSSSVGSKSAEFGWCLDSESYGPDPRPKFGLLEGAFKATEMEFCKRVVGERPLLQTKR